MKMHTKAKLDLLKRTAPRPIYWLVCQIVRDTESSEAVLRKRITELEKEMWFWRDLYQKAKLEGEEEEKL